MGVSFAAPGALWLLATLPVVWLLLRASRTNFNPRQRRVQAAVRTLLLATIALAIARPIVSLGSSQMSIVYVVDVSHSVSSRAIDAAAARIDEMQAGLRPAHSRIVAFAGGVKMAATTADLRLFSDVEQAAANGSAVARERTDIEGALRQARAELRPGHRPRLVLFSDGRAQSGDVRDAVADLVRDGIPVFVEPMAERDLGDVWLDRLEVEPRLTPRTLTTIGVIVGSQREGTAIVELREGTTVLARRTSPIASGETRIPVDVAFDSPGAHRLEASVAAAGDSLAANNKIAREAVVGSAARVLYVEGVPASAHYLRDALAGAGFDVTVAGPSRLPADSAQLAPWDVVIVSDVARAAMPDAAMLALERWVQHDGGGLLVVGGDAVFGEGQPGAEAGYRKSPIERLTPVTFERKDEPEVALIIVLDKSWSMAGQQMELCKTAAQAAIDVLGDEQSVGVVTFNDEHHWDVPLRNVGRNRDAIRKAVAAIEPSGHTLIYPALEQAYIALKSARARAKHVVLLSDGRSYPDDYEGLAKKMVEAKMTVSSIAVGAAADIELLTNIAKWGKGRSYVVEDAKEVPQIFVKEAKNVGTPGFDEKTVRAVVKVPGFFGNLDLSGVPGLRGRTTTVMKEGALEVMTTPDGDPLLAFWPIGLGRTAVFASDVKDRWATDWITWRGYAAFFTAVVRALERTPAMTLDVREGAVRDGVRPLTVGLEARDEHGQYRDLISPVVTVRTESGTTSEVTARQVAPGRYESAISAPAAESVAIGLKDARADGPSRLIVPDAAAEYRFRPPDEALLRSIADATGGAWRPSPDAIDKASGVNRAARRALWPALVVLALLLWLGDIALRRVRIFETA
jgi:Ca-activated chloride channel family protein